MSHTQQQSYEKRLEKAIFFASHPESLLSEKAQAWLEDDSNLQLYLQVLAIKEQGTTKEKSGAFDTKEAWSAFCKTHSSLLSQEERWAHTRKKSARLYHLFGNWRRAIVAAAISIPVILLASIFPIYHFTHKAETSDNSYTQNQTFSQHTASPTHQAETTDSLATEQEDNIEESWTNDYFHFENEPLENIIKEIADWYQLDVVFENEQARHLHFTFWASKKEPVSKTLDMLNEMGKVKFTIKGKQVIIQ